MACQAGHLENIKLIVKLGMKVNIKDNRGLSPLLILLMNHDSKHNNLREHIKVLLAVSSKEELYSRNNSTKLTPIEYAYNEKGLDLLNLENN